MEDKINERIRIAMSDAKAEAFKSPAMSPRQWRWIGKMDGLQEALTIVKDAAAEQREEDKYDL